MQVRGGLAEAEEALGERSKALAAANTQVLVLGFGVGRWGLALSVTRRCRFRIEER